MNDEYTQHLGDVLQDAYRAGRDRAVQLNAEGAIDVPTRERLLKDLNERLGRPYWADYKHWERVETDG